MQNYGLERLPSTARTAYQQIQNRAIERKRLKRNKTTEKSELSDSYRLPSVPCFCTVRSSEVKDLVTAPRKFPGYKVLSLLIAKSGGLYELGPTSYQRAQRLYSINSVTN
jgi:hypothetical protein